jgi:hypothetical protein
MRRTIPLFKVFLHRKSHFLNVAYVNQYAWTTWSVINFHTFPAFRKSFMPFKGAWTRHTIFFLGLVNNTNVAEF